MKNDKEVTIAITTFFRDDLLKDTLNSIGNQTYKNIKIIIGNDNPDRLLSIHNLGVFKNLDIKVFNQKKNLGELDNLNFLLAQTTTPYFMWISDDDVIHPSFVEWALFYLHLSDSAVAAYSNFETGLDPSNFLNMPVGPDLYVKMNFDSFIEGFASRSMNLIGCYGLFKSIPLKRIGGFTKLGNGFSPYSDVLLAIQIAALGDILYVDRPAIFLRTHPESMSSSSTDIDSYVTAEIDFVIYFLQLFKFSLSSSANSIILYFMRWFTENHVTVVSRNSSIRIIKKFIIILRAEFKILHLVRNSGMPLFYCFKHLMLLSQQLTIYLLKFFKYSIKNCKNN